MRFESRTEKKNFIKALTLRLRTLFLERLKQGPDLYVSFEEIEKMSGLNLKLKDNDQAMRSAIYRAGKYLKGDNYQLFNVRSLGYKIANKFESMDQKEASAIRMVMYQAKFLETYFNRTLTREDLDSDINRTIQHQVLSELQDMVSETQPVMRRMLEASPFFKKNKELVKMSDVDESLKEDPESLHI